jgi:GAF domain-containing protein
MRAPFPSNESRRLAALRRYKILDTSNEQAYDDITTLAAYVCKVPIAMISLVDENRQWFKSHTGVGVTETPRDIAFCSHAILNTEPLVIKDATHDARFADNRLVTESPNIRFYAGFPIVTPEGDAVGTLCAIDRGPRDLTVEQVRAMEALSRQVMCLLELRRASAELADALTNVRTLHGLLPICAWCKRVREDNGFWAQVEKYVTVHTEADFTHSICPDCARKIAAGNQQPSGTNDLR